MAPIVSIVGRSGSGKTTFLEKLMGELIARGYRVATMKHTPMGMTLGDEEKDSSRHIKAGAIGTIIAAPDRMVLVKPVAEVPSLDEIARAFQEDCDIVLTEGFKQGDAPKIEVHRKSAGPALQDIKKLFAVVTDEPLNTSVKQFKLDDVKGVADLLEEGFIKPQKDRILLYVNDAPIPLSAFPRDIVTNIMLAMANSLKGVGKVRTLKVFVKKEG
jgi:molybdopterin-guanine dinucleotide biosynthesis protein B